MQNLNEGLLFDPALSAEIKDRFYYVDADPEFGQRLFFENSGGSLRLKASVEAQAKYQAFPDCPERLHDRSRALKKVQLHGIDDIMHIVFGASGGALISEMTASQAMFQIVGAIRVVGTGYRDDAECGRFRRSDECRHRDGRGSGKRQPRGSSATSGAYCMTSHERLLSAEVQLHVLSRQSPREFATFAPLFDKK